MISKLDRYIAKMIICMTALVACIWLGVQSFMNLVMEMSVVSEGSAHLKAAFLLVLMRLPVDLYQVFPMVSFLGSLLALGRLASTHQLMAMETTGISRARILRSVMQAAGLMVAIMILMGEYVGPKLETMAEGWPSARSFPLIHHRDASDIWLKAGRSFIHIGAADSQSSLQDVTRFEVDDQFQLDSIAHAEHGAYVHRHWVLYDVEESLFLKNRIKIVHHNILPLSIIFNPVLWEQGRKALYRQPIVTLYRRMQYRNAMSLDNTLETFACWQRLLQPMVTLLMFCLAAPFVFGSARRLSMGARMVSGIVLGGTFYMLNQCSGPLVLLYGIPPALAAMMPTILFIMICAMMFGFLSRFSHVRFTHRN